MRKHIAILYNSETQSFYKWCLFKCYLPVIQYILLKLSSIVHILPTLSTHYSLSFISFIECREDMYRLSIAFKTAHFCLHLKINEKRGKSKNKFMSYFSDIFQPLSLFLLNSLISKIERKKKVVAQLYIFVILRKLNIKLSILWDSGLSLLTYSAAIF